VFGVVTTGVSSRMGMTCTLRRAGDPEIRRLLANPNQASLFLHGPLPAMRPVRFPGVLGFLLRLLPIEVSEADPSTPVSPPSDDVLDLEGSWHGLHFLFTGTAWDGELPAAFLVKGGTELDGGEDDEEDVVRVLDPGQVRAIDAWLQSLSRLVLTQRYDARRMIELEIEPEASWAIDNEHEQPGLNRLLNAFEELRGYVRDTCERGYGLVIQVS
jgi:hypothetical protein